MMKQIVVNVLPLNMFEDGMSIARQQFLWAMAHFEPNRGFVLSTYVYHRIWGILRRFRDDEKRAKVFCNSCSEKLKDFTWHDSLAVAHIDLQDMLNVCLNKRERIILKALYEDDMTVRKLSEKLNISRTSVSNIKIAALEKCREFALENNM
jgi:RNA polymerase sigma factor (sigma-70 family)